MPATSHEIDSGNEKSEKIVEYCPHCESEAELDAVLKPQVCPECGKSIMPCSLCSDEGYNCDFTWTDDKKESGTCRFRKGK